MFRNVGILLELAGEQLGFADCGRYHSQGLIRTLFVASQVQNISNCLQKELPGYTEPCFDSATPCWVRSLYTRYLQMTQHRHTNPSVPFLKITKLMLTSNQCSQHRQFGSSPVCTGNTDTLFNNDGYLMSCSIPLVSIWNAAIMGLYVNLAAVRQLTNR